jgi:hypothetical protein
VRWDSRTSFSARILPIPGISTSELESEPAFLTAPASLGANDGAVTWNGSSSSLEVEATLYLDMGARNPVEGNGDDATGARRGARVRIGRGAGCCDVDLLRSGDVAGGVNRTGWAVRPVRPK